MKSKTKNDKIKLLLTAGPANVTETVRKSLLHPDICHRDKEFAELLLNVRKKLVKASGGSEEEYTAVVFVNSGTGAIESVMGSAVYDKKPLIIVNGDYGDRIRKIAKRLDIAYKDIEYDHHEIPKMSDIEDALKKDKNIGCIAMVHMETTLGKINPVHEVGMLAKKYNKIYVVDAMASFATEQLNVKEDNIDFCIANSNKGIQGVPGLSLVIVKKTELEKIKDKKPKSLYLDLYAQYKIEEEKGQTPYTPAIQSFFGLNKALDELFEEGIENRINRYTLSSKTLIEGMKKMGIKPYLPPEIGAKTLTTFICPEGVSYKELSERLEEEGYVIYPGKGPSAVKTFRIGNLGIVTYKHIEKFLESFEKVFNQIRGK